MTCMNEEDAAPENTMKEQFQRSPPARVTDWGVHATLRSLHSRLACVSRLVARCFGLSRR